MIIKINGGMVLSDSSGIGISNTIDNIDTFVDFISDVKTNGLVHAVWGKSFFEVATDFLSELLHDVGLFILGNGDLFFLLPAIVLMFATFLIGKNKYTKWIIPLYFAYFVTTVLYKIIL